MRGNNQVLQSNETVSQASGQITLDSDGFTLGSANVLRNETGQNYVAWSWKAAALPAINTDGTDTSIVSANLAAGFSMAILPNKAGTQNLGHGLDGVPDLIIMKQYEGGTGGWTTYNSVIGARNYMNLNTTAGNTVATPGYEYDAVTATTITNLVSGSTYSYIYYCFKNVAGFSKVGSYSGNSSTQSITGLGFKPSWVMIKRYDGTENWYVQDSARGSTKQVYPNLNSAEFDETTAITSFDSDGWTMGSYNGINNSSESYIFLAFKENPAQPTIPSGEMEYLVQAGGASGASNGGGGGAGGLRTTYGSSSGGGSSAETNITLSAGTYTITVGGGGASIDNSTSYQSIGNSGTATTISGNATVNTVGGGGSNNNPPATGGCGGGSGSGSGGPTGAAGTAGEGFAGGNGMAATHPYTGGGGGGTAAVGATASASAPGAGGAGLNVAITGSNAGYGGGGGGTGGTGVGYTGPGGAGGFGGGGAGGAYNGSGTAGSANTGGGGGATGDAGSLTSGAGGSGVVILRMNTSDYSGSTTGSPTVTTEGSETILTYTGSGTYVHS